MINIKFVRQFVLFANVNGTIVQHHISPLDNVYQVDDISHANSNSISFTFSSSSSIQGSVTNLERSYVEVINNTKLSAFGPNFKTGCCE